jgi:hypothetical protein
VQFAEGERDPQEESDPISDTARVAGLQRDAQAAQALAIQAGKELRRLRSAPVVDFAEMSELRSYQYALLQEARRLRPKPEGLE